MAWPRTYDEAMQVLGSRASVTVESPAGLVGDVERDEDGVISITGTAMNFDTSVPLSIEIRGDLLVIMLRADGVVFASITDGASDPEIVAQYERIQSCYPTWVQLDTDSDDGMTLIVALGPWELDEERTRAVVGAVFDEELDLATAVARVIQANGSAAGVVDRGLNLNASTA
jgi:hypothetical protein